MKGDDKMKEKERHETRDGMVLEAGVRIHYTGDMANLPRDGKIERLYTDKWGTQVELTLDAIEDDFGGAEPERKTILQVSSFEPSPGRRFMTAARRDEERTAKIAAMTAGAILRAEKSGETELAKSLWNDFVFVDRKLDNNRLNILAASVKTAKAER
jgi:hypothetical protein